MRYVVSGAHPHSTVVDELDIEAPTETRAAQMFRDETSTIPDTVETIGDGEVIGTRDIDYWCANCDGPIFSGQDWVRDGNREIHADPDDCEGAE